MNQYEPLEPIGSGSFGIIRKVKRISDGKMTEKEKIQLVAEVNILRNLRHPNIVRYYERFVDRSNCQIYIIMGIGLLTTEYCEGGDLAGIIKRCRKEKQYIPEDNVFLDKSLNVKLGDFGLSRQINPDEEFAKTYVGTPYYMSPELVDEQPYNEKSDVWALGCLIYQLCALEKEKLKLKEQDLKTKESDLSRKEQILLAMEAKIESQFKLLSQKEKELEFKMSNFGINNLYEEACPKPSFRIPLPVTVGEPKDAQGQRYF
ncbi:hypothetical protein HDV06_000601 [Boothiomyces sp. JEL0866]|nr:hypothetical protein HDV06_000601 [Boothiomyces sp. JEL0866]